MMNNIKKEMNVQREDGPLSWSINGATAMFPGFAHEDAINKIQTGIPSFLGEIGAHHIQLCPQSYGVVSLESVERLRNIFPKVSFRPHANIRLNRSMQHFDASTDVGVTEVESYFKQYREVCTILSSQAVSIHAGRRSNNSIEGMLDNVSRIQDILRVPVGVEGLYPDSKNTWLLSTHEEYEMLLKKEVFFAIDLSHWNILYAKTKEMHADILLELLTSPRCMEIHLSGNNGSGDYHEKIRKPPRWMPIWMEAFQKGVSAIIFSEEDQVKKMRTARR